MIGERNAVRGCPGWHYSLMVSRGALVEFSVISDDITLGPFTASVYRTTSLARKMGERVERGYQDIARRKIRLYEKTGVTLIGDWSGDGIFADDELVAHSVDVLGLNEEELGALASYNRDEAWVWKEMARRGETENRGAISAYLSRRARAFNRLAAVAAAETDQAELELEGRPS